MTLERSPSGWSKVSAAPLLQRLDPALPQIELPQIDLPRPAAGLSPQFFADLTAQQRLRLVLDADDSPDGRIEAVDEEGAPLWSQDLAAVAAAVPCFARGTAIMTSDGPVAVEDLRPGSRIITRDAGAQPLLWSGQRDFGWRALALLPMLRPVRIRAGALGSGLPSRDLLVSPNHLLLAARPGAGLRLPEEMFLPARDLIGRPGIDRAPATEVQYLHLLLDSHHAILSEGCWSESLRPDPAALQALTEASRSTLAGAGLGTEPCRALSGSAGPRAA